MKIVYIPYLAFIHLKYAASLRWQMKAFPDISHSSHSHYVTLSFSFCAGSLPDINICISDPLWKYWIWLSQKVIFQSYTLVLSVLIFICLSSVLSLVWYNYVRKWRWFYISLCTILEFNPGPHNQDISFFFFFAFVRSVLFPMNVQVYRSRNNKFNLCELSKLYIYWFHILGYSAPTKRSVV